MLKLVNLAKYYNSDGNVAIGLRNINIEFQANEIVAIVGESGSGKTTLLNVISGVDSYEEGEMFFLNKETSYYSHDDWEEYRKNNIGFVFQNYNLIDSYNVLQNVETVLLLRGINRKEARLRALEIIDQVGLSSSKKTKAAKLSGGEKQRTALARALASDSKVLVCDEPTGNLDSESGKQIMSLINQVATDRLVIIVTHDFKIVEPYATRKVRLFDGEIVEDIKLKQTEEARTQEIVNEKEKTNPLSYLKLAVKNLLSTPKKSIFSLFIYLTIIIFIVSIYELVGLEAPGYAGYSYHYRFTSENRVVVNKKDGTAFSRSELDHIKQMSNVDVIYENDFFLELATNVDLNINNETRFMQMLYQNIDLLTQSDLVAGTMPTNDNEIVLLPSQYLDIPPKDYLNKEITIYNEIYLITGVTDKDFKVFYGDAIMFANQSFEKKLITYKFIDNFSFTMKTTNELNGIELSAFLDTEYGAPVEDDVIRLRIQTTEGLPVTPVDNIDIMMSHFYESKLIEDIEIDLFTLEGTWGEYWIIANENTWSKIINEDIFQISIMVSDTYMMNATLNELDNLGYNGIIPASISSSGDAGSILFFTIFKVFMIFIALLSLYLISYLILAIITKSKQKDYAILRILGVNKKNLNYIVIFENLILALTSFFLMLIIVLIINNYHNLEILKIIKYNEFYKILFLLIVVSILAFFISIRFTKNLFKTSVNSSLRRE